MIKSTIVPGTKEEFKRSGVLIAIIRFQDMVHHIEAANWFEFMKDINNVMKEFKIEFPLGEDADMKMVTKKVKDVEKFR